MSVALEAIAYADEPPTVTEEQEIAEAKRLSARGEHAAACEHYAAAQRISAKASTQLALASCYEKAGRYATAAEAYERLLADAQESKQTKYELAARGALEKLRPQIPRLLVTVPDSARIPDLEVRLNDAPFPIEESGEMKPRDPGTYVLKASAPGITPWQKAIQLKKGATAQIEVPELHPPAPKPSVAPVVATAATQGGSIAPVAEAPGAAAAVTPQAPTTPPNPAADSVVLLTGEALYGKIVEQQPGRYVTLQDDSGRQIIVAWGTIRSITVAPPSASPTEAPESSPAPTPPPPTSKRASASRPRPEQERATLTEAPTDSEAAPTTPPPPDTAQQDTGEPKVPSPPGRRWHFSAGVNVDFSLIFPGGGSPSFWAGPAPTMSFLLGQRLPGRSDPARWWKGFFITPAVGIQFPTGEAGDIWGYLHFGGATGLRLIHFGDPPGPSERSSSEWGLHFGPYLGGGVLFGASDPTFIEYGGVLGVDVGEYKFDRRSFLNIGIEARLLRVSDAAKADLALTFMYH